MDLAFATTWDNATGSVALIGSKQHTPLPQSNVISTFVGKPPKRDITRQCVQSALLANIIKCYAQLCCLSVPQPHTTHSLTGKTWTVYRQKLLDFVHDISTTVKMQSTYQ